MDRGMFTLSFTDYRWWWSWMGVGPFVGAVDFFGNIPVIEENLEYSSSASSWSRSPRA